MQRFFVASSRFVCTNFSAVYNVSFYDHFMLFVVVFGCMLHSCPQITENQVQIYTSALAIQLCVIPILFREFEPIRWIALVIKKPAMLEAKFCQNLF